MEFECRLSLIAMIMKSAKHFFIFLGITIVSLIIQFEISRYQSIEYCENIIANKLNDGAPERLLSDLRADFNSMNSFQVASVLLTLLPFVVSISLMFFMRRRGITMRAILFSSILSGVITTYIVFIPVGSFFDLMHLPIISSLLIFNLSFSVKITHKKQALHTAIMFGLALLFYSYILLFFDGSYSKTNFNSSWEFFRLISIFTAGIVLYFLLLILIRRHKLNNSLI